MAVRRQMDLPAEGLDALPSPGGCKAARPSPGRQRQRVIAGVPDWIGRGATASVRLVGTPAAPPEGGAAGTSAMAGALLLEASTGTFRHRSSEANLGLERRRNQGGDAAIARPRITSCYMAEIGVKSITY